jgi:hypothetical protein
MGRPSPYVVFSIDAERYALPLANVQRIEVGANAYIVKSSFDQSNLLDVVQKLI